MINVLSLCMNGGVLVNLIGVFGVNGIFGIGLVLYDCGMICVMLMLMSNNYYVCLNGDNVSCMVVFVLFV